MNKRTLPDTLHELLSTAISNARSLSRDQYRPRYDKWHTVNDDGLCEVCLTGGVMAAALGSSADINLQPCLFPPSLRWKLEALHFMSIGHWVHAYGLVHLVVPCLFTEARLSCLPAPAHSRFIGWEPFESHLMSLESIIPRVRAIET